MAGQRVSQSEFARQNGWSRQYVAKLVQQGRIKLEGGKIDPVAAKRVIAQLAEPSTALREKAQEQVREKPEPSHVASVVSNQHQTALPQQSKTVDYAAARTMREAYRAKMARLDFEEREGKLIDATKVKEEAFQVGRMVRDGLLAIPDRMADVLAAETDAEKVKRLLQEELETVLTQLNTDAR